MEDLNSLRMDAERIPLARSPYLHPDILRRLVSHRQNMLTCDDVDLVKDYICRATDEECLAVLAGIEAYANLSDDYQWLFSHLACTVYHAAGLEIPAPARCLLVDNSGEPISRMRVLETFRREVRKTQRGVVRGTTFLL